jgi:processive 1,2-diacylglycerol beta-glucosyltransferase
MSTDLVVVYSPVGGGHKAAAIATVEAARARGLSVELVNAFEHAPRWAGEAYVRTHLTGQGSAPGLYGQMYFAANRRDPTLDPLRAGLDVLVFGALRDRIGRLAPRAIVATHHLPLVVLGRERRKGRLDAPLVGVVTDYIAHACWAERGVDAFAVPYGAATDELAAHGIPRSRVFRTGIPVRAAFERAPDLAARMAARARTTAGGQRNVVNVLVTSGGFGVGPMTRIVRSFTAVPDVHLTVVCGAADKLAARVRREAERCGVPATVLGFEKDMAARVADADVVVGKAGGLTVTEALTAGRPMVITSAVPGNEAVNEAFVVAGGAGVGSDPDEVGAAVAELRDRGRLAAEGGGATAEGTLAWMGARARTLVPTHAADRVVALAMALAHAQVSERSVAA